MNISILISSLNRGGAERVAAALANDFYQRGDNITVICLDKAPPSYSLNKNIQFLSVFPGENKRIISMVKRLFLLKKNLRQTQPDVVLCFSMKNVFYALLARPRKSRVIGSERSNPYYANKNMLIKLIEKLFLPLANGYIFLTSEGKEYYSRALQRKSTVIPNGLFAEDIPKKTVPFETRRMNIITAVGRLHPVKDHVTMIKAFKLFQEKHSNYKLKIYGDGIESNKLKKLVQDLGLSESVTFEGIVDNVVEHIADSGMFILTSKSESWGNALMEALSCGIPSISTDCDFGPRAMIENEVNGLLVPVGDVEAIARAMDRIAVNQEFARNLSENALLIRKSHSSTKIANRYYEFIKKISTGLER
ncbi:glycosyltransferase [Oceanobacillus chungangensis]|uniref:Glycosyltransferase family 4 protein n=1 Tax=Oceanobacillus chungangensis TaxID=1229152 RepID=A0A3D8PXL1_9BACI|nr:glycosyltransferase [Oceanobacillus chungangensis]RDW20754.1 hypothetical protein CWR45_05885 [Oceanobacillus chungangensis]